MSKSHTQRRKTETGVALLIAIFTLLLIAVVAISLIVAAGMETSLSGNYRSSTSAFYAAKAGLEEARGRLLPRNPDYFNTTSPSFVPAVSGAPLAVHEVR
jgi:Tfp pilus assembly protein PilX